METKILGVAASLRNARWGKGRGALVESLLACPDEEALRAYLVEQAELHLENFVESGRAQGLPFDEIYANLRRLSGKRGLSNSEILLAAALWAAASHGARIEHLSLSEYFPAAGVHRRLDDLKSRLRAADGLLLSTPVYFGDRSSLSQDLVDLIRDDPELRRDLTDKVYVGVAVGAKRNGGQESTLIYQLFDMVNLGLLGVGNDSDTTSQYGGTGHAGDVGTAATDDYGIWTSMGAGRRLADVARLVKMGQRTEVQGPIKAMFWVLQDKGNRALDLVSHLIDRHAGEVDATVVDVANAYVSRCIACDICPTHIDVDEAYRCIIQGGKRDSFEEFHSEFLDHDVIVPVVYSPNDRTGLTNNYQKFVERTRYLRRGDYVFSDKLTTPLVLEDVGVLENMQLRMATSLIRHHTVLTEPMVAYSFDDTILNLNSVAETFGRILARARLLVGGTLSSSLEDGSRGVPQYNPVGYVLSAEKEREDQQLRRRRTMVERRRKRIASDVEVRLPTTPNLAQ